MMPAIRMGREYHRRGIISPVIITGVAKEIMIWQKEQG